jgi:hypothetical protein
MRHKFSGLLTFVSIISASAFGTAVWAVVHRQTKEAVPKQYIELSCFYRDDYKRTECYALTKDGQLEKVK